jgi:transposase
MQKALTLMNVQLANAVTDLSGQTGMAILRAIVGGERNPWILAKLRDKRIQASEEEIAHSLHGNWREDVLFELEQVLAAYDFQVQEIEKCEQQLEKYMKAQPTRPAVGPVLAHATGVEEPPKEEPPKKDKKKTRRSKQPRKNRVSFDSDTELARVMGADLTVIDGIKLMTVQTVYSELGPDLSAFPTENHFASWLMLAPKRDISGGKGYSPRLGQGTQPCGQCPAYGRRKPQQKPKLLRGSLSIFAWPTGSPESHQGHGPLSRMLGLSHAHQRTRLG